MATSGKVGRVLVQAKENPIAFVDEPTIANATFTRYTIADSDKCYWNKDAEFVVKKNGEVVMSGYHLEYPGGVIVFDSPLSETDEVTISGECVKVEQLAGFFEWSLNVGTKTLDATCFESGEWEEFELGTKNFTASAQKFWVSKADFSQRIGEEVIVVLYTDFGTAKTRFEGYATIETDAVNSPVNELINDSINFKGYQGIYFRAA